MGFFDKISDTITETGQDIKRMANQSSAKSQLNSELRRTEKELEALVYQIGYELISKAPDTCKEHCPEAYTRLVNAREAAKNLRNQIALTEVEIVCPGCGRVVKGAQPFCTYCGFALPEPNFNAMNMDYTLSGLQPLNMNQQAGPACPTCGAPLKEGAAFCINCGTPVTAPQPQAPAEAKPAEAAPAEGETCKNCGAPLQPEDAFCTNCGTPK